MTTFDVSLTAKNGGKEEGRGKRGGEGERKISNSLKKRVKNTEILEVALDVCSRVS